MTDFSERLKELREEKELSQNKLSKLTGISQNAISKWETREHVPTSPYILKLAEFFGCTTDYILGKDKYK